jgi:hypothetical protein
MYYIVETEKSFDQASTDLAAAVIRNGFGVLHVQDLGTRINGRNWQIPAIRESKTFCRLMLISNRWGGRKNVAINQAIANHQSTLIVTPSDPSVTRSVDLAK